jgi:hypothetical protein
MDKQQICLNYKIMESNVLSFFNASGQLTVGSSQPLVSIGSAALSVYTVAPTSPGIIVRSALLQTANPTIWQSANGNVSAFIDPYGNAVFGGNAGINSTLSIYTNANVNQKGITVRGDTGQTADLFELQDNGNNVLSFFNASGQLTVGSSQPLVAGGSATLSVYTNSSNNPGIVIRSSQNQAANPFIVQNYIGGQVLGITDGGKVQINGSFGSPVAMLSVKTNNDNTNAMIIRPGAATQLGRSCSNSR